LDRHSQPIGLNEAQSILQQLAAAFPLVSRTTETLPLLGSFATSQVANPNRGDAALPEIDARYQTLIEQIPAVVFMAFLDKGIGEAYVSPQIEDILGFSQEEWLNDPVRWYQQIHPDDKDRWSVEAAELFLLGQPLKSLYRVIARDGRVVWFHCEAKMVRNQDGRPWFIHGVAFDISELKSAEEALKESEEMLRGLFESAPDTVLVITHEGEIANVNVQVERMFGYPSTELVGKGIDMLIPEGVILNQIHSRQTGEPHTPMNGPGELYGRRKDGTRFPVDIMLSPMNVGQSRMVIGVVRDIT
jgi:PAS domain S-box-containing protein